MKPYNQFFCEWDSRAIAVRLRDRVCDTAGVPAWLEVRDLIGVIPTREDHWRWLIR